MLASWGRSINGITVGSPNSDNDMVLRATDATGMNKHLQVLARIL